MKVGNINLFSLIVKISTAKSFVKLPLPLAWQRGFAVGGCEMQKDTIACVFFGFGYARLEACFWCEIGGANAEQPI
jgi:hypothetical protein